MISLLYIGNKLMKHGYNPTSIETLGERLKVNFNIYQSSSQRIYLLRLFDMWLNVILKRNSVQAVLIDTYGSSAFHYAWTTGLVCRIFKLPYIPILRGGELPLRIEKNQKLSKSFAINANMLVAPSGFLEDAFTRFTPNISVIPNYIDLKNYPFKQREEINPLNILWVRSFHQSYQPKLAVQLVNELKNRKLRIGLTMVGPDKDGSMEECKQLAKELGVIDQITFTGRLSKKDWIDTSANHNLFLNTTSVDNTPVSVMEAMALGMPVVTTKVGGIPYLFEDGVEGIMVEEQSPKALANQIETLMQNPQLTKDISQAARKKSESWDWEVVRLKWIDLLENIN